MIGAGSDCLPASLFSVLDRQGHGILCICFEDKEACRNKECERFFPPAYQLISRIASIAAGYEIEKILKEGGCKEEAT